MSLFSAFLHLAVIALITAAALHDWKTFRLPHVFTISAAALAIPGFTFLNGPDAVPDALLGSAVGFFGLKAVQILSRYRHGHECLGSGDCILMLSLGAMTGLESLPLMLAVSVAGAAVVIIAKKPERVAFGPFLVLGALVSFLHQ